LLQLVYSKFKLQEMEKTSI